MFTRLSIMVPTRKRIPQLLTLLDSYARTRMETTTAELIFRIDVDDWESKAFFVERPWTVLIGPRYDGYRSLPKFFEELRHVAKGDLLMCGNDDMVFRTLRWPELVIQAANQYPDGIFDFGVSTLNHTHYPFSIVSKMAIDRIGYLQDPQLFWGDVYLRDVMAAFGRAIPLPSVQIDHCWMGHAPDATFQEAHQEESRNWDEAYWTLHRRAVANAVEKLKAGAACLA